jgi:hypothetical protein
VPRCRSFGKKFAMSFARKYGSVSSFEGLHDRLTALEKRAAQFAGYSDLLRADLVAVRERLDELVVRGVAVENALFDLNVRVNGLADDMRQRFRLVTESIAAIERRLAA